MTEVPTIDPTGGMDPLADEVTAETPSAPEYLEGANMWIWDDAGRVGLPRVAIDAMGAMWERAHVISVNLALPGGRVLVVRGSAPPQPVADGDGRPRVLGAGPLRFECLEPFRHWRMSFDGLAGESTIHDQIAARGTPRGAIPDGEGTPLQLEVEARMVAPPWVNGTHDPEGQYVVGEHRIEQLFLAEGTVQIGASTMSFRGGGLRIHRKGGKRSEYSDWCGHSWMSGRFPSGRAFGINNYHPRPDGSVRYHEGWLLDGGEISPAKFVDAPWKRSWEPSGEDVSFTLRTPRGDVHIEAETYLTTVNPIHPVPGRATFPATQQGIARYRWDDEEAYGMIERSSRLEAADTPS